MKISFKLYCDAALSEHGLKLFPSFSESIKEFRCRKQGTEFILEHFSTNYCLALHFILSLLTIISVLALLCNKLIHLNFLIPEELRTFNTARLKRFGFRNDSSRLRTRITTKNIYKAPSTVSPSQISTQVRFYHGDIYPTTSTEHFA